MEYPPAMVCLWSSENNLKEYILSTYFHSQNYTPGHQPGQQMPLPSEPSRHPQIDFISLFHEAKSYFTNNNCKM